jgi:colicin import membrane protein
MAIVRHKVPRAEPPLHTDPYFYGWRMVERQREDGSTFWEQVPLTEWDVLHPQEGDFIVHNDAHNDTCFYLKAAFRWKLTKQPQSLVLCDHRIDWQVPGILPHGPDITVLFDALPWDPRKETYPVRDMGARPVLVIEITSPTTRRLDLHDKVNEYGRAGVPFYAIIDQGPSETYPELTLLAYQTTPKGFDRVRLHQHNRLWLPELELWLVTEGKRVVCLEPSGTPIDDYLAVAKRFQMAEAELRRLRGDK